ncbi:isocitrate/isopropylmalate family dehydrogenase [Companilactobacillus sp. HBUAS59544]|uniref:isocitrate/isopropylmalate family dehydrogenase n=1 Tax=Companilactobacillus sp. HBUAS59544 TaxID=3109363 RepID=UPI002FF13850
MQYTISVIPGDGIGPELVKSSKRLLSKVGEELDSKIYFDEFKFGNTAVQNGLPPSSQDSINECTSNDAILLGNVWLKDLSGKSSPHEVNAFLGQIRKALGVYANIRPIMSYKSLFERSPLRDNKLIDCIFIREMSEGMLSSDHKKSKNKSGKDTAIDYEYYDEDAIRKVSDLSIKIALQRNKQIINVDKAIVLASSQLWRKILYDDIAINDESSIKLLNMFVDDVASDLIINPDKYNVILTTGMFGDILSDELATLTGTPQILASIEEGVNNKGLYSPLQLHNSNEEIVGTNKVNPLGILSATSWLVRMSLNQSDLADQIDFSISHFINKWGMGAINQKHFTTEEITTNIIQNIDRGDINSETIR